MPATSVVVTVKTKLRDLLRAREALQGVQIEYMNPLDASERAGIFLADGRGRRKVAAMRAGRKPRDEDASFDVYFVSAEPSTESEPDGRNAELAAFALMAELEDLLAEDPTLDGTVNAGWVTEGDYVVSTYPDPETQGWECAIRLEVLLKARLT